MNGCVELVVKFNEITMKYNGREIDHHLVRNMELLLASNIYLSDLRKFIRPFAEKLFILDLLLWTDLLQIMFVITKNYV